MSLEQFQTHLKNILRQIGHTQQQLAGELGLHPTLLTNKLKGVRKGRLTNQEIKQIILILAGWEAFYSRREVVDLLAHLELPPSFFSPSEWERPPLKNLDTDAEAGLAYFGSKTKSRTKPADFERTHSNRALNVGLKPANSGLLSKQGGHYTKVESAESGQPQNGSPTEKSRPTNPEGSAQQFPQSIPQALTRLIGREEVLEQLEELICQADVRLVTLVGTGGIGKTRVAQAVAQRLLNHNRFKDGVFFVELDNLNSPALVPKVICNKLGLPEKKDNSTPLNQLSEFIAGREMLLVLDNFEQLLEAAPTLHHLLLHSPRLRLLVTSRITLGIYGEWEFTIPPLPLPQLSGFANPSPISSTNEANEVEFEEKVLKEKKAEVAAILQNPTVALFVERARAANSRFTLNRQTVGPVINICRVLAGIPLAIELAAARIRLFELGELENLLQQSYLTVLKSEGRLAQERSARHRSLEACLAWSYSLLTPEEQTLFCRLGIFADSFGIETAGAILPAKDLNPAEQLFKTDELAVGIEALLSQSLLQPQETSIPEKSVEGSEQTKRFRMLEPLREFALEQLRQSPAQPQDSAQTQNSKTYYEVWEAYCLYWAGWVKKAVDDLYGPKLEQSFFRMQQEYANILSALEWGLQNKAKGPVLALAAELAFYWIWGTQYSIGTQYLDRVLSMVGIDIEGQAGSISSAIEVQSEAELSLLGKVLYGAGFIAVNKIEFQKAENLLQQSLAIFRKLQDKVWLVRVLGGLAFRATSQGQFNLSRPYLDEGLALSRKAGDESRLAASLNNLSVVSIHLRDDEAALGYSLECLSLVRKQNNKVGQAMSLNIMGYIMVSRGENRAAQEYLEESLEIAGKIGYRESLSLTQNVLALNYYYQQDFKAAMHHLNEGLRIAYEMGDRFSVLYNLSAQPMVRMKQHTLQKHDMGQPSPEDATNLAESSTLEKAVKLLGATAALTRQTNGFAFPRFRELFEEGVKAARERLDPKTFEQTWKSGEEMSLDEAVNYALNDYLPESA